MGGVSTLPVFKFSVNQEVIGRKPQTEIAVHRRPVSIAAPMGSNGITSTIMELAVYPVVHFPWRSRGPK